MAGRGSPDCLYLITKRTLAVITAVAAYKEYITSRDSLIVSRNIINRRVRRSEAVLKRRDHRILCENDVYLVQVVLDDA